MNMARTIICCLLSSAVAAQGATVSYVVVPTADPMATTITVTAGEPVGYTIFVTIDSDDPAMPDSDGLGGFSVDLLTDLGVAQQEADEFGTEIVASFPLFPSLGSPNNPDDLRGISAFSEALLGGTGTPGIALDETIPLATGSFLTDPASEGTFTIMFADNASANLLNPGAEGVFNTDTILVEGFTIVTVLPDDGMGGTDDGMGSTDDGSGGPSDGGGTPPLDPFSSVFVYLYTIFGLVGIVAALVIAIGLNVAAGTFF